MTNGPRAVSGQPLLLVLIVIGGWVWLRLLFVAAPDPRPPVDAPYGRILPFTPPAMPWHAPWRTLAATGSPPSGVEGASGAAASGFGPATAREAAPGSALFGSGAGSVGGGGFAPNPALLRSLRLASRSGRWDWAATTPAATASLANAATGKAMVAAAGPVPAWLIPPGSLAVRPPMTALADTKATSPWSGYGWLFARSGPRSVPGLLARYGGSQAGMRLDYRLAATPRLDLFVRGVRALARTGGTELAVGAAVTPVRAVPLRLSVERRVALDGAARSGVVAMASAGFAASAASGRIAIDGHAQAGAAGLARRDLFAEGGVRGGWRVAGAQGPVTLTMGAGAWGGAQPGAARFDIGPQATADIDLGGRRMRLSLDWRQRVGGNSAPGSGAALTLSTGF